MWTAFVHLLWHAFRETINEKGTTVLAFIVGLLVTGIQQIVAGKKAFLANLRNWKTYIGVVVGLVVWCLVFIYTAASIVYEDHTSLRAAVGAVHTQPAHPEFRPAIVNAGVFPAGDKANAAILIVGTIYNYGAPGMLNDIYVELVFADGKKYPVKLANPGDARQKIIFGKNARGKELFMPGSQYWLNERSVQIPTFGRLDGFVMGLVRGVTKEEIGKKLPVFVLTCTDVTGKRASAEHKWGSGESGKNDFGLGDLQRPLSKR
jgi:hypothetical protein